MAERTFPTTGISPVDVYMVDATTPGMYVNVTTVDDTTNQSYIGGVMYADDATTKASGTSYGFRFRMTASGTKTGGDVNALGVRLSVTGASPGNINALSIYTAIGAVETTTFSGIYMYMDTMSTSPTVGYGINLGIVSPSDTAMSAIRVYNHSAATALYTVFQLDNAAGVGVATNLFSFGGSVGCVSGGSDSANCDTKIACSVGGGTRYLHLFTD